MNIDNKMMETLNAIIKAKIDGEVYLHHLMNQKGIKDVEHLIAKLNGSINNIFKEMGDQN